MTALVLIDVQKGLEETSFYGTERNNLDAEKNCGKLLRFFRTKSLPVFHVKHNSSNIDSPLYPNKMGNDFHPEVRPLINEPVFEKKCEQRIHWNKFGGKSKSTEHNRCGNCRIDH